MKKLGETRVPKTGKTATASTRVYFYKSLWGKNKVEIDVHGECRHNCIGYVTVRHPLGFVMGLGEDIPEAEGIKSDDSLWGKNKVEIDVHGECRHNCIGYVTVRHPQIMFGTWEQSLNTFCNIAERYLIRKKILKKVETESGTKILVLA